VRRISAVEAGTESGVAPIYTFEAAFVHPPQPKGWRDIHDRINDMERIPQRAEALAKARQRLASALHPAPNLASLRLEKGLSQQQLARNIGTSQSRLSRIESGLDDPRLSTVRKLAEALGVGIETVSQAITAARGPSE